MEEAQRCLPPPKKTSALFPVSILSGKTADHILAINMAKQWS